MPISRAGSNFTPTADFSKRMPGTEKTGTQELGAAGPQSLATVRRFLKTWSQGANNAKLQSQADLPSDLKSLKSQGRALNERLIAQIINRSG